ncbi:hypothetical protein LAZ67_12002264 [Cordylochernes scorpioides]|uniref:Kazal-like domain-containing protein n=1 Tax=Cordylochernes scorpioides TaxID=51811 RepID=A0ABY6L1P7_9ARAC|nr:hypothetical protein LAZ67_12002264 [Cordylochernes scorpioides]
MSPTEMSIRVLSSRVMPRNTVTALSTQLCLKTEGPDPPVHTPGDEEEPGDITSPCKPNPCNGSQVCVVNRNCQRGYHCRPYTCVPGCRLGDKSKVVVPANSYLRTLSPTKANCQKVCKCNHRGETEDCMTFACNTNSENCWVDGRKIMHNSKFQRDCNICFCYDGSVTCTKKTCGSPKKKSALPCSCVDHYVPVCGANGKTYPSACLAKKFEQRICIKFCYKIGKSASKTLDLLKLAFGNENVNKPTTFRWFSRFKNGMESVKDEKRVGRPILHRNPEKVSQISNLIKENPRIGLRDIEEETEISKSLVGSIIKEDLQLNKTPSKFVPKMLTIQQKENRIEKTLIWKEKVITGDETWVYGYDPETKRQSMEWKGKYEPRTKKSRLCKSKNKVLLVTFFDTKGIVHYEYLEEGQTINKESYLNIMRSVRESIRLKISEMWSSKNWIIHHDNAPPHTATSVLTYLAKHGIQILQQPSPDLAPNDFFLFPKLKRALKGRRFDTRESIIADSKKFLKNIPKDAFSKCFKSWEKRWKLYIDAGGDYFEKC